jgi:ferredoxin
MAHRTAKKGYVNLVERLNRFPQGAPPSEVLFEILKLLFSEREASLVALLPIKPFTEVRAARIWKMPLAEAQRTLETLASRAILLDGEYGGLRHYVLPPPMAGFFEFSLMRLGGKVDQKLLSQLFHQYLNVEEDFIRELLVHGETQMGRVFVQEPALTEDNSLHVLDYERASEIIKTSSHIGVGICYCRHKMEHLNQACSAPMEICMTFNSTADSLISNDYSRRVAVNEGLELLQQAYENNLVQFGENVRNNVSFVCNCCSCCCEAMVAARKFGILQPVHTTNFIPVIQTDCNGCGKCVSACPVEAMTLISANLPNRPQAKRAKLDEGICLGCGVCVRVCPSKSVGLEPRPQRVITPVNSVHRIVMMAIERGKLQNLIFDNQAFYSHRAMAAILGVILKLPPIKQTLASRQFKSRYLEALITKVMG